MLPALVIKHTCTCTTGDSGAGDGVSVVVEESGPVQYDEGDEGLDDEEMEELAYEDDPLLHSDYEDEGE